MGVVRSIMWRHDEFVRSAKNIALIRSFRHQFLLERQSFFFHTSLIIYAIGAVSRLQRIMDRLVSKSKVLWRDDDFTLSWKRAVTQRFLHLCSSEFDYSSFHIFMISSQIDDTSVLQSVWIQRSRKVHLHDDNGMWRENIPANSVFLQSDVTVKWTLVLYVITKRTTHKYE